MGMVLRVIKCPKLLFPISQQRTLQTLLWEIHLTSYSDNGRERFVEESHHSSCHQRFLSLPQTSNRRTTRSYGWSWLWTIQIRFGHGTKFGQLWDTEKTFNTCCRVMPSSIICTLLQGNRFCVGGIQKKTCRWIEWSALPHYENLERDCSLVVGLVWIGQG